MSNFTPPTATGIAAAAAGIDPIFLNTPLVAHDEADAALGCRLLAKAETLNPIRSFKGRGTDWWLANLAASDRPIVSASAGNFGQGLAYAARRRGRRLTIFAATTANPGKVAAMRRLGATVVQEGADFDAAKAAARRFAATQGLVFVEDGGERLIAEGAGTIAREITETLDARAIALDTLVVPLGNGALLTGMGAWMRVARPGTRVIGVVAAAAPAMKLSFERGRAEATADAATTADGIAVREPVDYALACMPATVDEVVAVEERAIADAMDFCRRHYGLVVEPAGAAGLAALMTSSRRFAKTTVATVLCGGNIRMESA